MKDTFQALGTTWWVEIFDELSLAEATTIFTNARSFCEDYEKKYSRFKTDSEISKLNQQRELIKPSEELISLLKLGKKLYLETNTKFNFLTGHVQESIGYDDSYSFKPSDQKTNAGNPVTDLKISNEAIQLTQLEVKVDLGGYGKGYLVDLLAEHLKTHHSLKYFLINGGGDIYATSMPNGGPIEIYLENPLTKHPIYKTSLLNQGFGASSSNRRRWSYQGKTFNHILGTDSEMIQASFTKAPSTVYADVMATCLLLGEPNEFSDLIEEQQIGFGIFDTENKQLKFNKLFN
jgi:thiamine biosynthesis lipoprotein